jgi:hypothetical protein
MYVALMAHATVVGDNTQQQPGLRGTPARAEEGEHWHRRGTPATAEVKFLIIKPRRW